MGPRYPACFLLPLVLVFLRPLGGQGSESPPPNAPPALPAAPASAEAHGGAGPLLLADDPAPLLGMGLVEALGRLGPPSSVYAVRGEAPWQDDVAFAYAPGYALFWFGDRLWQIRFAAPYAGSIYGLFLGDPAEKAYSLLGQPYEAAVDALVYRMPYRGYPVRLRLAVKGGILSDAYLYRADF